MWVCVVEGLHTTIVDKLLRQNTNFDEFDRI